MSQQQTPPDLDLKNIQGDILSGFPKKTETNYFFEIIKPDLFREHMAKFIPLIKTVDQILKDRDAIKDNKRKHPDDNKLIPIVGVNVSFSHFGLQTLGIEDENLADTAFLEGQLKDSEALGDPGARDINGFEPNWEPEFKKQIHGVFLVAGDSRASVNRKISDVEAIFGVKTNNASINLIIRVTGDVRPGKVSAHEHFGFLDGISNPAVIGFDKNPPPGPAPVRAGAILLGHPGDENQENREPWMVDGSFLVFRYLFQHVPEFDKFIEDNAIKMPGLSKEEGKELLGARLVGRWKSGAPIDLTPFHDNPSLVSNPNKVNNFHFTAETSFQKICPFAAHIRKTLPRADLEDFGISIERNRIMRRGIQFGPEVTKEEEKKRTTIHARGLLFQCYQSSINNGFRFMQTSWSNNPNFPINEQAPETPGFDPIIGQGANRKMSGFDPNNPGKELDLPAEPWVVPRGGEYFFTPSIKGLKEKFVPTRASL